MKIVRIRGGLGNQMFQYAFCEWLRRFDEDVRVDESEFWCFECHDGFEVEKIFNVSFDKAKIKEIVRIADYIPIPIKGYLGFRLFQYMVEYEKKKVNKKGAKATHIYQQKFNALTEKEIEILFENESDLYLDGYWNNAKYYDSIDFARIFSFRNEFIRENKKYIDLINTKDSCSVHIRRGDYVNTTFDVIGKEYYIAAMKMIVGKYPNIRFYVFSDDINEARVLLGESDNITYMDIRDKRSAGVDMMLMSMCEHNIIANSTYSFWGAKLNKNPDKVVIAPRKYKRESDSALADEEWIVM